MLNKWFNNHSKRKFLDRAPFSSHNFNPELMLKSLNYSKLTELVIHVHVLMMEQIFGFYLGKY